MIVIYGIIYIIISGIVLNIVAIHILKYKSLKEFWNDNRYYSPSSHLGWYIFSLLFPITVPITLGTYYGIKIVNKLTKTIKNN